METIFTNGSQRTWQYATDPDSNVHNTLGAYAEIANFFRNTINNKLFYCTFGGSGGNQNWESIAYQTYVQSYVSQEVQSIPQSDWNQGNASSTDYIKNKPSLATVATTGAYVDLTGKPVLSTVATTGLYADLIGKPIIPSAQIQADWTQASTVSLDYIKNKPILAAIALSGMYTDLIGKPSLSTVATSGMYSDLSGRPSLAAVALTGSYNDLSNKPSIPATQIQSDWTQASTGSLDYIKNKPTLATVATTGSYSDLSSKPTIPTAQIQSDWIQTNIGSLDYIKNKPTLSFSIPTFSSVTTATQLSTTRNIIVFYSFPFTMTSLLTSQSLTATLQFADDAAMTTNVVTFNSDANGISGILNVAVIGRLQLHGTIPAGKYRKVSFSQTGGATIPTTLSTGQEVIL